MHLIKGWIVGQSLLGLLCHAQDTQSRALMTDPRWKYQICSLKTCGNHCSNENAPPSEPILAVDSAASGGNPSGGHTRRTFFNETEVERKWLLDKRASGPPIPPDADYVKGLVHALDGSNAWTQVPQFIVSGEFHPFSAATFKSPSVAVTGMKGLRGCSAVAIISKKGVYLVHIFESPGFLIKPPGTEGDMRTAKPVNNRLWRKGVLRPFRYGNEVTSGFSSLIERGEKPLDARYRPIIIPISPTTMEWEKEELGIETDGRHDKRMNDLTTWLKNEIPGSRSLDPFFYLRISWPNAALMAATLKRYGMEWFGTVIIETVLNDVKVGDKKVQRRTVKVWVSGRLIHQEPIDDPVDEEECAAS